MITPFVAKPGETITGFGFDFSRRLSQGETLVAATVVAASLLVVSAESTSGAEATATITVPPDAVAGDYAVAFTVTGSLGSVRKATRTVMVRNDSD